MLMRVVWAFCALLLVPALAWGQGSVIQAGPPTGGHAPMYTPGGSFQTVIQDSGPASGGLQGLGLSELLQVNPSPLTSTGSGPLGTHDCHYSAPVNSGAYYYLCLDANAQGGGALIYGNGGTAPQEPFNFFVNGTSYQFPFVVGGIVGPSVSVVNDLACWNNTTGTLLKDCGSNVSVGNLTVTGTLKAPALILVGHDVHGVRMLRVFPDRRCCGGCFHGWGQRHLHGDHNHSRRHGADRPEWMGLLWRRAEFSDFGGADRIHDHHGDRAGHDYDRPADRFPMPGILGV